jgi:hypothetical protein
MVFVARNDGLERGAEFGNVPLSVTDLVKLPPDCMLWRDCEKERQSGQSDRARDEDAFADRLHDIQRVDVVHAAPAHLPMTRLIHKTRTRSC